MMTTDIHRKKIKVIGLSIKKTFYFACRVLLSRDLQKVGIIIVVVISAVSGCQKSKEVEKEDH